MKMRPASPTARVICLFPLFSFLLFSQLTTARSAAFESTSLDNVVTDTLRQRARLSPGAGARVFGFSVSLSGNRALVGALPGDNGITGSAYVFVQRGANWSLEAELKSSDGTANDGFGAEVSLSGNRALVGASSNDAVYVFLLSGSTWTQEAKLVPADGHTSANFGGAVSLLGGRALIGAPSDNSGNGSAYVFTLQNGAWSQTAKLDPPAGDIGGGFGVSVSLSGKRALIGGLGLSARPSSVYVYFLTGPTWILEAELTASDGVRFDGFGFSVSLAGDRALVGAPFDDNVGFGDGSAYVFAFNGTTWTQEAKLAASDPANNDAFGRSVSLSGSSALVGAPTKGPRDKGTAYRFTFDGTTWSQQDELYSTDTVENSWFGFSVSLLGDHALIGARGAYVKGAPTGAAYLFGP